MNSRRDFLSKAAVTAGMVFCGCGLSNAAHAQQGKPARLPVTVDGKRVKTIDVHAHCLFHDAANLMGEAGAKALAAPIKGQDEAWIVIDDRIKVMDGQAIDME